MEEFRFLPVGFVMKLIISCLLRGHSSTTLVLSSSKSLLTTEALLMITLPTQKECQTSIGVFLFISKQKEQCFSSSNPVAANLDAILCFSRRGSSKLPFQPSHPSQDLSGVFQAIPRGQKRIPPPQFYLSHSP